MINVFDSSNAGRLFTLRVVCYGGQIRTWVRFILQQKQKRVWYSRPPPINLLISRHLLKAKVELLCSHHFLAASPESARRLPHRRHSSTVKWHCLTKSLSISMLDVQLPDATTERGGCVCHNRNAPPPFATVTRTTHPPRPPLLSVKT